MIVLLTTKLGYGDKIIGTCRIENKSGMLPIRINPINLPGHRRFDLMGTMLIPKEIILQDFLHLIEGKEMVFYRQQDFENIGHAEMIE